MNLQDNKLELITNYRKVYSDFIESIDFDLLQQSDKQDKQTNKQKNTVYEERKTKNNTQCIKCNVNNHSM